MNPQNNTAVVKQAYAAFGRGDIPGVLALVDRTTNPGENPWTATEPRRWSEILAIHAVRNDLHLKIAQRLVQRAGETRGHRRHQAEKLLRLCL